MRGEANGGSAPRRSDRVWTGAEAPGVPTAKNETALPFRLADSTLLRALGLEERRTLVRPQAEIVSSAQGEKIFARWLAKAPFATPSCLDAWLQAYELTRSDLARLLEVDSLRLGDRSTEVIRSLDEACDLLSIPFREDLDVFCRRRPPCLLLLAPLADAWQERAVVECADLTAACPGLEVDVELLVEGARQDLDGALEARLLKTVILEMNVARLHGELAGESPEERFRSFVARLGTPAYRRSFFEEYPVLLRLAVERCQAWARNVTTLLGRLTADLGEIRRLFFGGRERLVLESLALSLGDPHRGFQTVAILGFGPAGRLVYKPRSLAPEALGFRLAEAVSGELAWARLRTLRLLDRGSYGWMEHAEEASCAEASEVEIFYRRQGVWMALFTLLRMTDLHHENLIAAGPQPVYVDQETCLAQPPMAAPPAFGGLWPPSEDYATVASTGLLPQRLWGKKDEAGVDISGLGGQEGQRLAGIETAPRRWGRDDAAMEPIELYTGGGKNLPRLAGEPVTAEEHLDALLDGFAQGWEALGRLAGRLEAVLPPATPEAVVRHLVRPTRVYSMLYFESFHPDYLRDAEARERLFGRLWTDLDQRPSGPAVALAETRDLLAGDIPYFSQCFDETAVRDARGEPVGIDCRKTPADRWRDDLCRLRPEGFAVQAWLVETAFANRDPEAPRCRPPWLPESGRASRDVESWLAIAEAVAGRLEQIAYDDAGRKLWVSLQPAKIGGITYSLPDWSLYSGQIGIILFLAYLAAVTGRPRWRDLAWRAVEPLAAQVACASRPMRDLSVFQGRGGLTFLAAHLETTLGDGALCRQLEAFDPPPVDVIEADRSLTFLEGVAGFVVLAANLVARRGRRELLPALRAGAHHLVACGERRGEGRVWNPGELHPRPLNGLTHGAAGFFLALVKAASVLGDPELLAEARRAWVPEHTELVPAAGNWPDHRSPDLFPGEAGDTSGTRGSRFMVAWCHGAPGIGLSRLEALPLVADAVWRRSMEEEVRVAFETTAAAGPLASSSLCHGELGNLDFLLLAAAYLGGRERRRAVQEASARVLASLEATGPACGYSRAQGFAPGCEVPGLFVGLSGVGYQCLRMASPEEVPSVLALEVPRGRPPSST